MRLCSIELCYENTIIGAISNRLPATYVGSGQPVDIDSSVVPVFTNYLYLADSR